MDRTKVRELREELKKYLKAFEDKCNVSVEVGHATFSDALVNFKIEVREMDDNGITTYSDIEHSIADNAAKMNKVKFQGHILGSTFNINDTFYKITEYGRRGKYNFKAISSEGKRVKMTGMMLSTGTQILPATLDQLKVYFMIDDIEDDRISREDERTYNAVNDWLSTMEGTDDEADKMFALMDKKIKSLRKVSKMKDFLFLATQRGTYSELISYLMSI